MSTNLSGGQRRPSRPARRGLLACAVALLLASCGGGGSDTAGVGSGGTGTYASGRITAFGSIVVNGIHFDQQAAAVAAEDGSGSLPSALQLGMTVEVDATAVTASASRQDAVATAIRFRSELLGPVDSVGASALVVMGQPVAVTGATQWGGGLSAPADLAPGEVVEVYGFQDVGGNRFVATRIERRNAAAVSYYKVRGVVSDLNYTTMTCRIGGQLMSYVPTQVGGGWLADGRVARALLQKVPAAGRWSVQSMAAATPLVSGRGSAVLEGAVTALGPSSTVFSVDGTPVDVRRMAACAACSGLQPGAQVRVTGSLQDGVVFASEVTRLP
ncbi:MAG: hypothetical protein EPO12_03510 [Aquabacterium sp.]|jgi:hypothetical protein|nr:MAG: hypothetical protein EPO12_03510 [Aquabacterium sp.]